jgi:SNF2 family DNA or RNA helicase
VRTPLKHQADAVARFSKEDRAAMFLDMRLGKSYATILWAAARGYRRVLLLAPATPLIDWADELLAVGVPHQMVSGSPTKRAELLAEAEPGWCLMTYGSAIRTPAVLQPWDLVVLDESTTIKNPKAEITKWAFKELHEWAGARAVLSGLPFPQRDTELWCQMAWASPDRTWLGFNNFWKFREAFCYQAGFDWTLKSAKLPIIKAALHRDAVVLSRKEAGLPNIKQYQKIRQPLDPLAEAAMARLLKNWELDWIEYKHAPVIAGVAHRLAGGFSPGRVYPCWKYGEVHRILTEEFPEEQVVVWFAYNPEITRMKAWLESKGIPCSVLVGTMSRKAREAAIREFRAGKTRVFLGQVLCGKFGLDLSNADVEVYFSCPYSYEGRRQSEERIIHPTKKRDTLVLDLVSQGSADEAVMETLRDRKSSATYFLKKFSGLFGGMDSPGSRSTRGSAGPG